MKKVLKYLSLILLFVFSITLAACDDDSASTPEPSPDSGSTDNGGTSGGSNGGTTGEQPHTHSWANDFTYDENQHWKVCSGCTVVEKVNHNYGEWSTTLEPTFITKGSKKKSCTCGNVVVESIAATGVDFEADAYTTNLLSSIGNKACLTITEFDLALEAYDMNIAATFENVPLYVELDEEGNIYAYATGSADITIDGLTTVCVADVVYKDDFVYFYAEVENIEPVEDYKYVSESSPTILGEDMVFKIPAGEVYTDEVPLDDYMDELEALLANFEEEIAMLQVYMANIDEDVLNLCINKAVQGLVGVVFTTTEDEGFITYSLNYEALKELNEMLDTMTISELYDEAFGEGAYAELPTMVEELFDYTIADLNDYLQENELDLKTLIDCIDMCIKAYDPELSFKDYFEEEVTNEEIEDLIEYLNRTEIRNMTIAKIYFGHESDADSFEQDILMMIDAYENVTVYEVIAAFMGQEPSSTEESEEEYSEMKQMVDMFIDMFDAVDNCSFTTDLDGNITDVDVALDFTALEAFGISGTITGEVNLKPTTEYAPTVLINKVNSVVAAIAIDEETTTVEEEYYNYLNYDDEFTFDADGNVTGYTRSYVLIDGDYVAADEDSVTHDVYVTTYTYNVDLTKAPISINPSCNDLYKVSYLNNGYMIEAVKKYSNVEVDLDTYNNHVEDLDAFFYELVSTYTDFEEEVYEYETNSIDYYYNAETNTVDFNHISLDEAHNFVKNDSLSIEGSACCDLVVDYYICEDCGTHYVEYYGYEHTGTISKVYNEVDSCYSDDLEATCTCSDCNMTWTEYPYGHYDTLEEIDLFEGLECEYDHDLIVSTCACGQLNETIDENLSDTMTEVSESADEMISKCEDCGVYIVGTISEGIVTYYIYNGEIDPANLYKTFTFSTLL